MRYYVVGLIILGTLMLCIGLYQGIAMTGGVMYGIDHLPHITGISGGVVPTLAGIISSMCFSRGMYRMKHLGRNPE